MKREFTRIRDQVLAMAAAVMLLPAAAHGVDGREAGRTITDPGIATAVETEYMMEHLVPFDAIDVTVESGIVTLSGTVDSLLAERRAIALAESIKGVRSVVDLLEVKPVVVSDDALETDIEDALLSNPAADSYEVQVKARSGHVTLDGTVNSWEERQLVQRIAERTRGVASVDNEVDIQYETTRPDYEIRQDIRARLDWDARVHRAMLKVAVDEGDVTLTGIVGSAAERTRARNDAWVAGVRSVDVSGIQVEDWADNERLREKEHVIRSDDRIRSAVKDAMFYDPRVASFNPEITVNDGVVTLRGVVDNLEARGAAEQVARNTVGVWRVENHLKVRPARSLTDDQVVARVEQALARNPIVERFDVTPTAYNGHVVLFGIVDTYSEKYAASGAASTVAGVVSVDNNIKVDDDTLIHYDPGFGDDAAVQPWDLVAYDWDYYRIRPSDREIADSIESQLFWSPYVDEDEVDVRVDNGIATLGGTVDSWHERESAEENAFEGGAVRVVNNLTVE